MSDFEQAVITGLLGSPLVVAAYNFIKNTIVARTVHRGWQAVFLTNGQVYFGKIKSLSATSMRLEDVYYVSEREHGLTTLIKLGDEKIHAPKDIMTITRSEIVIFEGLQNESEVMAEIAQHKLGKALENINIADLPDVRAVERKTK